MLCVASSLKVLWYGSMDAIWKKNFSWNEIKNGRFFCMEWKWNERKLAVWNMEKSSSFPSNVYLSFHQIYFHGCTHVLLKLVIFMTKQKYPTTNFYVNYYLQLKLLQEAIVPCFPPIAPRHLQNLTLNCEILSVFWP